MEQTNIENQITPHVCTSSRERVAWTVLAVVALVLGIIIGMFWVSHSSNPGQQVGALTQQQQQQIAQQQAASAIPLNGQVVSILNTSAQSGTIQLRVSFAHVNNPTFQNPYPRPNIPATSGPNPSGSSAQSASGIKTLTVSFTKNTVFTNKKASEIKAGDYLSVRSASGNYASGKPFTATQVSYFNPVTQIEQMVTGGGHTLFGKVTSIKTVGSSKIITVSARIVNKKEFANVLLTKVATKPYPHSLLRSDVSFSNKPYTVTINSGTHVNYVGKSSSKLAVGTTVAVSGKEDIYTTNKITAVSLAVLPPSPGK
ncbi:MAG TPA: hypothetical protein ENI56_02485 [Candidatus Kaiserbacteria bacterium]|nr:hypothetical protein [Candidatus Kaiserbacteria bacterium]